MCSKPYSSQAWRKGGAGRLPRFKVPRKLSLRWIMDGKPKRHHTTPFCSSLKFCSLVFSFFFSLFLSLFLHLSLTASSALHGVWVYTRAVQIPIVSFIHGLVPTMSSLLSRLNPAPAFPAYTGPYKVGTQELEIPISDLPTSSPPPDANITTVSFRIFYPCEPTKPKFVYWLPSPQGDYFRAYARFLSAGPGLASFLR